MRWGPSGPAGAVAAGLLLAAPALAAPLLFVSPDSLSFGPLGVGESETQSLLLRNDGDENLVFGEIQVDLPGVVIGSQSGGLPPGTTLTPSETRSLELTYAAAGPGSFAGTLVVPTNDPVTPERAIPVLADVPFPGSITVGPPSFDVTVEVGSTLSDTLTIGNAGAGPLNWEISVAPGAGPAPRGTGSLTGVRVLWDRSHGQSGVSVWSTLVDSLEARGAVVEEVTGPTGSAITETLLDDYQVYVTLDVQIAWSVPERRALEEWAAGGGGIVIFGDNLSAVTRFNDLLGRLGSGITYSISDADTDVVATNVSSHPTTAGVDRVYLGIGGRVLSPVDAPAEVLVRDPSQNVVAAAERIGAGRLVVVGDEVCDDGAIQNAETFQAHNLAFGLGIFDWLANEIWLSASPRTGTVAVGDSAQVTVTFDATNLTSGAFDARVRVSSNDPVTPRIDVPAHLQLTGAPDIDVTPTSLDFGSVPVQGNELRNLTVRNLGLDSLRISTVTSSDPHFDVAPGPFTVAPFDSLNLVVTFSPDSITTYAGQVTIGSDDPDESSVNVSVGGTGIINCSLPCATPFVAAGDTQGGDGSRIGVDIVLEQNPAEIFSFGLSIHYDPCFLSFGDSTQAGDLTQGFSVVSAQENEPGRATLGGFGTTAIPASSSGTIARLFFDVSLDTCAVGPGTDFTLSSFIDDIELLNPCCGSFTLGCPQGTGDVNDDGTLTPQDALCALKIYLNGQSPPADPDCEGQGGCEVDVADVDCEGTVTPGDALDIYERWQAGGGPASCFAQGPVREREAGLRWGPAARSGAGERTVAVEVAAGAPRAFGLVLGLPDGLSFLRVERGSAGVSWSAIEAVQQGRWLRVGGYGGDGTPGELIRLVFRGEGTLVLHRADDVDFAGDRAVTWGSAVEIVEGIERVGPVPGRAPLEIVYGVERGRERIRLQVHDVVGRLVRTLLDGTARPGRHRSEWDGLDGGGRPVASGIYFLSLELDSRTWTRKAILLR